MPSFKNFCLTCQSVVLKQYVYQYKSLDGATTQSLPKQQDRPFAFSFGIVQCISVI